VTHLRKMMLEELQRRNFAKTTVQYYLGYARDPGGSEGLIEATAWGTLRILR
jgi:hypothetical protein